MYIATLFCDQCSYNNYICIYCKLPTFGYWIEQLATNYKSTYLSKRVGLYENLPLKISCTDG